MKSAGSRSGCGALSGGAAGLTSVKEEKEEGGLGWKSHRVQALAHLRLVI